ncbi:MAG: efflux transporter outer membrane subunit, partial [Phyllobacterium sp.]|nr:efflux transporter outer membrane subunit [Phyllobacterium sp.]
MSKMDAMTIIIPASPDPASRGKRHFRLGQLLGFLLLSSSLAGCVVGPDYQKPMIAMPGQWGSSKQVKAPKPAELSNWWKRLRDPELDALVDEAVAGNLDVATAKAKIREARATYRQTAGTLLPSLDGSASATRNRVSATSTGTSAETSSQFQTGFDASWELDLFGANKRSVEAAKYGLDAAGEDLRSTLLTLIGDVTSNYAQARGYQARIALARRTAASQRETAALTRTKFEAGSSSALDVANAAGLANSTEANIPSLETSYAEAVHRLSVLTGRAPAALMDRLKRSTPIPTPRLPVPTGVPADILRTRPDVRMAERQYAQYTAKIGQAEAARYPSVSLTGNIDTTALKEQVIDDVIQSAFGSAGQRCSALRVLYVPRDSADALIEGLKGALAVQIVADPADLDSLPGPRIDPAELLSTRMGIEIVSMSLEEVVGRMPVAGNLQPFGLLHGGASAVLAESLGSTLSALHALPERFPVGLELACTHHRAA